MVPRPTSLGQPPNCLSKIDEIQVKRNCKYIFSLNWRDRRSQSFFFCSICVVERLVLPRGCHLVTRRELKEGPFACQEVLHRPGSLLVAQREEGHKTQLPGVQVAVWLEFGRTVTQRYLWKGAVLDNSQPVANLNKTINRFLW